MSVIILVNSLEPSHVVVSVGHEMDIYQTLQASRTAPVASTDRGDQTKLGNKIYKNLHLQSVNVNQTHQGEEKQ